MPLIRLLINSYKSMGNFENELHNFQNVPRELVFDNALSDRARFVYVFMACKPEGWEFYLEPMAKDIGYSVETLRKYVNELIASGWLAKGEQKNEKGVFGAVSYRLLTSKFTVTENFRVGKSPTQYNIENNNIKENNKEKTIDKKKELFEECWKTYRRKGSKKLAFEQWCKLKDEEKKSVMPHIKVYVQAREYVYQKDFERYLRDRIFNTIVISGNNVLYDPTKGSEYTPQTGGSLFWSEQYNCYMYIGFWSDYIPDGYKDDERPDGATVMLNNSRGTVMWSAENKKWDKI